MPGCSTHTAAVCQPRGLLQCPGKWESAWSARGTWAAAGREQWSIRGCCRTAVWFRTESASHLHNRKWLDPPHPLQNTERGLRVGESPVLLVSKLPPRRDAGERSGEYTRAGFKKSCSRCRFSLFGEPGRHWILRKTRQRADDANHPVLGRDAGNMNTHGTLQANH